jgi:hypothetical protein
MSSNFSKLKTTSNNSTVNHNKSIINNKSYVKNNILSNNNNNQSISIEEEIENLKSVLYQLEFLNLKLQNSFNKQQEMAEGLFAEKIDTIIKLREYNFNISSRINNMNHISKIEEYLSITYPKISSVEAKVNNVLENLDDFKLNINYGLDRLYLEDNIVCDENAMIKNIQSGASILEKILNENKEKFEQISVIKDKYYQFLKMIEEEKIKLEKLKNLTNKYKQKVLQEGIDKIENNLVTENKKLNENLFDNI